MNCESFDQYIRYKKRDHHLLIQPRVGFSNIQTMTSGLKAVASLCSNTVGTITIDSYTRNSEFQQIRDALEKRINLNGYPLISHGAHITQSMIQEVSDSVDYPFFVQVRHGSAKPFNLFKTMVKTGITISEGGPISYCIPYSSVSIQESTQEWIKSVLYFVEHSKNAHIESFGGCLLGQLCPPSFLIAVTILEGLFFRQQNLSSISLSYSQGTNLIQDMAGLRVLNSLAKKYLGDGDWHIVVYTFMGLFPKTIEGAKAAIKESVILAKLGGAARLIVKTTVESQRIPTIEENIEAMIYANEIAMNVEKNINSETTTIQYDAAEEERIFEQAINIIESVLNLSPQFSKAFPIAFSKGLLDVPYSLHPDNLRKTSATINDEGYLEWENIGHLAIPQRTLNRKYFKKSGISSSQLLTLLSFVQRKFDERWSSKAA